MVSLSPLSRSIRVNFPSKDTAPQTIFGATGCGLDGRAPRLGRGGPQFESGHPDIFLELSCFFGASTD